MIKTFVLPSKIEADKKKLKLRRKNKKPALPFYSLDPEKKRRTLERFAVLFLARADFSHRAYDRDTLRDGTVVPSK